MIGANQNSPCCRCALVLLALPAALQAAQARMTTNVVRTLASEDASYGGCMAQLRDSVMEATGLDCSGKWVTFSCAGEHTSKATGAAPVRLRTVGLRDRRQAMLTWTTSVSTIPTASSQGDRCARQLDRREFGVGPCASVPSNRQAAACGGTTSATRKQDAAAFCAESALPSVLGGERKALRSAADFRQGHAQSLTRRA